MAKEFDYEKPELEKFQEWADFEVVQGASGESGGGEPLP